MELKSDVSQIKAGLDSDITYLKTGFKINVTRLEKENTELKSDITKLKADKSRLESDITHLKTGLRINVNRLENENTELQSDITKLKVDKTRLQDDILGMKKVIENMNDTLHSLLTIKGLYFVFLSFKYSLKLNLDFQLVEVYRGFMHVMGNEAI